MRLARWALSRLRAPQAAAAVDLLFLLNPATHNAVRLAAALHLGRALHDAGRVQEALEVYEVLACSAPLLGPPPSQVAACFDGNEHSRSVRALHALALENLGRVNEAVAEYEAILAQAPTDSRVHLRSASAPYPRPLPPALTPLYPPPSRIGVLLQHMDRVWEARSHFRSALEADPSSSDAKISLAGLEYQFGSKALAAALLKEVTHDDPSNRDAHANLGAILLEMGARRGMCGWRGGERRHLTPFAAPRGAARRSQGAPQRLAGAIAGSPSAGARAQHSSAGGAPWRCPSGELVGGGEGAKAACC